MPIINADIAEKRNKVADLLDIEGANRSASAPIIRKSVAKPAKNTR